MPWYRTIDGQLLHGEGELAAVLAAQGGEEVDEATAVAEVESGKAQADADAAAAASAATDDGPKPTPPADEKPVALVVDSEPYKPLTDEEQARVDAAVADESDPTPPTSGGLFGRRS